MRVHRVTNGEPSAMPNWTATYTDLAGEGATYWNATEHGPGEYLVNYTATHGNATRVRSATVTVPREYESARNLTLWRSYGAVNATMDYDLWRIKHPSGCDSWFNVTAASQNGADIDLYLRAGDPMTVGSDNATYATGGTVRNGTGTSEWYRQTGVAAGSVYTLMIRHKATDTPYEITYRKSCGGGSDEPPRSPLDLAWAE